MTLSPGIQAAQRHGWRLIPVQGKAPTFKNWPTHPGMTPEHASAWLAEGGNLGVLAGGNSRLIIVDVDGILPPDIHLDDDTPQVNTARGRHYYYRVPPGVELKQANKVKLFGCLDVRHDGGMCVYPGSTHPNGTPYEWRMGYSPFDVDVADAPQFILDALQAKEPAPVQTGALQSPRTNDRTFSEAFTRAHFDAALRRVATAPEGARNDTLNRAAFSLAGFIPTGTLDAGTLTDELSEAARAAGLDDAEIRATIASGLKSGIAKPRTIPAALSAIERAQAIWTRADDAAVRLWARARRFMRVLASIAGSTFFLSCRTLADVLKVSHDTAHRLLKQLIADGFVVRLNPGGWTGRRAATYSFVPSSDTIPSPPLRPAKNHVPMPSEAVPSHTHTQKKGAGATEGGQPRRSLHFGPTPPPPEPPTVPQDERKRLTPCAAYREAVRLNAASPGTPKERWRNLVMLTAEALTGSPSTWACMTVRAAIRATSPDAVIEAAHRLLKDARLTPGQRIKCLKYRAVLAFTEVPPDAAPVRRKPTVCTAPVRLAELIGWV